MTAQHEPATPLTARGVSVCRGCEADDLESVIDLGDQPLANELLPAQDAAELAFPLHVRVCTSCGLGQVGEFVLPERIFGDYPYLSSVSSSWVSHARAYARQVFDSAGLADGGLVVEIASNDGYLLKEFIALGATVLGVEPAANIAEIARAAGVDTMNTFFGREAARTVVAQRGHPRLVAANNVMAHVPDLDDFVGGLAILCDDSTVISVENPSFATLLQETQFDTIYHEHYSYLSAHAVQRIVARHGLELFRTEDLSTHGGSYRYWIGRSGQRPVEDSVEASVDRDLSAGLLSRQTWSEFERRSRQTIDGLREWLDERLADGVTVAGYGAAAKGNTLLNAAGARAEHLSVIVDGSSQKQGKFSPGSRIPIVKPADLADTEPADVLILPWNIAAEIAPIVADLTPKAQCWAAIPQMRTVPE